ncbi:MAG: alkylhydroperoxidase domain protein [Chloroflexota bacterium]|nr:alkylhydroperoxidase domain protein [Chloroflexota bacterium]
MTHIQDTIARTAASDILDALLGVQEDSALAQLRSKRPEATAHAQGAYDALFSDTSATRVSRTERLATALRVAALHAEPAFVEHYAALLRTTQSTSERLITDVLTTGPSADGLPPRLQAILAHADLLVIRPAAATPADLDALGAAGLSAPEIVTVSQLVAFTAFHIRVFVGLTLIGGADRSASPTRLGPQDAPSTGFTQEQLGWTPWIEPFAAEDATPEQRAVLPGQRLDSPYFRLLALDPTVLGERTATDMGIFYTHGGLPRPERELSATVTSRVNGCIFCASVHSRFAAQLSKRSADVQRVLDDGVAAELDPRWRALADLAAALTVTPPAATPAHIARLRDLGLDDLDLLDAVQASAFFAWANRLMLSLGEPVRSAEPA